MKQESAAKTVNQQIPSNELILQDKLRNSKTRLRLNVLFSERKKASENDNERMTLLFRLHSAHVRWLRPVIGQISSLQATQMTQEAAIRDLDNERSRLKDKVLRLEEERESLQSQCQALEDRQNQQLLSLEKVCTRGRVR